MKKKENNHQRRVDTEDLEEDGKDSGEAGIYLNRNSQVLGMGDRFRFQLEFALLSGSWAPHESP